MDPPPLHTPFTSSPLPGCPPPLPLCCRPHSLKLPGLQGRGVGAQEELSTLLISVTISNGNAFRGLSILSLLPVAIPDLKVTLLPPQLALAQDLPLCSASASLTSTYPWGLNNPVTSQQPDNQNSWEGLPSMGSGLIHPEAQGKTHILSYI